MDADAGLLKKNKTKKLITFRSVMTHTFKTENGNNAKILIEEVAAVVNDGQYAIVVLKSGYLIRVIVDEGAKIKGMMK
jgi:hypothetical protein